MTNPAQSHPGAVRELAKSLSGIYRNACPGITEMLVRELLKPAPGALAQTNNDEYENQTRRLSLLMMDHRGAAQGLYLMVETRKHSQMLGFISKPDAFGFSLLMCYVCFPRNVPYFSELQVMFFLVLGLFALKRRVPRSTAPIVAFPLILVFLSMASIAVDLENAILADFTEIFKYLLIGVFILVGIQIQNTSIFFKFIFPVFCVSAVFGILEVFFPTTIDPIRDLYVRDKDVLYGKPVNFWGTTYFAAFFYFIWASIFLIRLNREFSVGHICGYLISAFLLIVTQSRSAFIAIALISVAFLAVSFLRGGYRTRSVVFFSVVAFLAFVDFDALLAKLPYLTNGVRIYIIGFADSVEGQNSLGTRVSQIMWSFEENKIAIIGSGIGKAYSPNLESWPALFYYRYGLIGIILYVTVWSFILVRVSSIFERFLLLCVSFGVFIISMSSVVTDQLSIIPITYILLGSFLSSSGWFGRRDNDFLMFKHG